MSTPEVSILDGVSSIGGDFDAATFVPKAPVPVIMNNKMLQL